MNIWAGILGSALLLLVIGAVMGFIVAMNRLLGGHGNGLAAMISGISVVLLFFLFIVVGPNYFVLLIERIFEAFANRRNK